jgi:hypothetical protein
MNDSYRGRARRAPPRAAALLIAASLLAACGSDAVDPVVVGTWEIPSSGGSWQLAIDDAGRYAFTNAGVGAAPSHNGTFTAREGEWSLRAATGDVEDHGTYELVAGALQLTGNRGVLRWGRAAALPEAVERRPAAGVVGGASAPVAAGNLPNGAAPTLPAPAPFQTGAPAAVSTAPPTAPAAAGALPDIIDPCLLITPEEASNLLDTAVTTQRTTPQPRTQNDCFYRGSGRTLTVSSYNGGGLDTAGYLEQRRSSGGESLPGVGDGAYLTYRAATGLTSVDFVIERASVGLLASGIARERADPGLRQLAAQAATRLRTSAAAFRVPGTSRFSGTWKVTTTSGGMRSPDMAFWVEQDGRVGILTSGGSSGNLVLEGSKWRIEDPFNTTSLAGEYRLRGDRFTLEGDALTAELDRVACKQRPQRVKPPYDFTRDIGGMLSGARPGSPPTPAPGSFDTRLAGLWEGEGKLNGSQAQFLVSITTHGSIVLAAFPALTGRLEASDGKYTLAIDGFGQSSGTYQFAGGVNDGTIRMEEDGRTYVWTPYDPGGRPPYEEPIVASCG